MSNSTLKITEIRNLSDAELVSKKQDSRQGIFNLRLQQQTGALEKTSRLGALKKDIAKIETVASERRKGLKVVSKGEAKPKVAKTKKEKAV